MKTLYRALTLATGLGAVVAARSTAAQVPSYPSGFYVQRIPTNGTVLHVRVGGTGPAVVLLHGYGETGDMWAPLATKLASHHTVIVPDLRGMGLSDHPATGYDKKTQGRDIAGLLDALDIGQFELVTHDIGNMVGYALAAQNPTRVTKFALLDAPLPGIGPWDEIVKSPFLWHFRFGGPDMERLVDGRERIYLDRFWNEFSADPKKFDELSRQHYATLYARPGAMHSGFEQFKAFDQDAVDNRTYAARGMLTMPVLAIGGDKSFGETMAAVMRFVATDVRSVVIPNSGHWLMEENAQETVTAITEFLAQPAQLRLTPQEIAAAVKGDAGAGTSGVAGIRTTTLSGNPSAAGPYTIEIRVPAHTQIAAHSHRDDRSAVVVSGTWYFGYGATASREGAKALAPGSFYTEPGGHPHFAMTGDEPAVVYITGVGPTSTLYVDRLPPRARRQ